VFGGGNVSLLAAASEAVSVAGAFLLFAAIFKLLPARRLPWQAALVAAALTTGLFTAGRLAMGVYLSHSGVSLAFGPAGSLAIVLLWIYYASLSFLASTVVVAVSSDPYRLDTPVAAARHDLTARLAVR
jgi:membrane protein